MEREREVKEGDRRGRKRVRQEEKRARTLASAAASQLIGISVVFRVFCGSAGSCCLFIQTRDEYRGFV